MDDLTKIDKVSQFQKSTKAFQKVANVFGLPGKIWSISDLAFTFREAQKTGNWSNFGAKISELGSGMLIGSIVMLGVSVGSIPVALTTAVLGVIASHYLSEDFWFRYAKEYKWLFLKISFPHGKQKYYWGNYE